MICSSTERDRLHWLLLGVFLAASLAVFSVDALNAAAYNRVFLGADGSFAPDQLQYLSWATDAAHHGLSMNLYAFGLGGHVFLHPVWLLTGLLHVDAGLSYPLLLLIWKLVAVVLLFAGVRWYVRSQLGPSRAQVPLALLVATFMVSPAYLLGHGQASHGSSAVGLLSVETFPVYWVDGYFPIALAVASMLVFLVNADSIISTASSGGSDRATISASRVRARRIVIAGAAGAAAGWLHPWQGVTLILIVVGLVLWERPSWLRHRDLLLPVLATALPVAYYAVLPRIDAGWALAQRTNTVSWTHPGAGAVAVAAIPIVLLMLPGYAIRAQTAGQRMLRVWPVAIAATYVIVPADKYHAIDGFSIPAALLMIKGWPWIRCRLQAGDRWARAVAVVGLCIPVLAAPAAVLRRVVRFHQGGQLDSEISRDEARVLGSIASSNSGGVLTTEDVGAWVPALTDHPTWIGHPTWSPYNDTRSVQVALLFSGAADRFPARERSFVLSTGARFVVEPCGETARLDRALRLANFRTARYGCATLYWRVQPALAARRAAAR